MRLPSSASRGRWRRAEPDSDRVVRRLESVVPDLVSSGSSVGVLVLLSVVTLSRQMR